MSEKVIQATILSLGYLENGDYCAEPDCLDGIKDLIRYLHGDDSDMTIRRLCTGRNIVKNDLVPILRSSKTSDELFDTTLRLTINLCQPTLMVLGGRLPPVKSASEGADLEGWQHFYEAEANLGNALAAFTHPGIFQLFHARIGDFFAREWVDRTEREKVQVERILVLLGYVFTIGYESAKPESCAVPGVDPKVDGKVVASFFKSALPDLLLRIVENPMDREFFLHVLAILALLFKRFVPKTLALSDQPDVVLDREERREMDKELSNILHTQLQHEESRTKQAPRRSFLQGSFVVKGEKPLNAEQEFVIRKSIVGSESNPVERLSQRKRSRRIPKNRLVKNLDQQAMETKLHLSSGGGLSEIVVAEFCECFLTSQAYNKLMRGVKDLAFMSNRSAGHQYAELHYFSLVAFMTEFARLKKTPTYLLSSTFSVEGFHHLVSFLDTAFEHMKVDKAAIDSHLLKAQYAVTAYKEMIIILGSIHASTTPEEKQLFRRLCDNIFSIEEYRELGYSVMAHMKPGATTKRMLRDLVLINHYYLYLMEKLVAAAALNPTKEKPTKRKAKRVSAVEQAPVEKRKRRLFASDDDEDSEEEEVGEQDSKNDDAKDGSVANGPGEKEIGEQDSQNDGAKNGPAAMDENSEGGVASPNLDHHESNLGSPTTDREGSLPPETDKATMANDGGPSEKGGTGDAECSAESNNKGKEGSSSEPAVVEPEQGENGGSWQDREKEEEDGEGHFEEDVVTVRHASADMTSTDFDSYVMKFTKRDVIAWYVYVLREFDTNPAEVNNAILKLFHRVAFDLKNPAYLYLATLFRVFKAVEAQLLKWPAETRKGHKHHAIYKFGAHLLEKFFQHFKERGPVLVCELLFSKSAHDCYEIEYGYGSYEERDRSKPKKRKGKKADVAMEGVKEPLIRMTEQYSDEENEEASVEARVDNRRAELAEHDNMMDDGNKENNCAHNDVDAAALLAGADGLEEDNELFSYG